VMATASARVRGCLGFSPTRVDALAATLGDPAQLLDVEMDELARTSPLVADDRTRRAVEAGKDGEPSPSQDAVHGRRMHAQLPGNTVRTGPQLATQAADRLDHVLGQSMWCAPRPAGAVSQSCITLRFEPLPPLGNRAARDTLRLRHLRLCPALLQALDDKPTTRECELPVSMGQERGPPTDLLAANRKSAGWTSLCQQPSWELQLVSE